MTQVTSKERNSRFDRIRISQERPTGLPHGDNNGTTELYLENGTMDKQSYVVPEHILQVPASQLRSCSSRSGSRAYNTRLCAQSYTLLMGWLGLEPEDWVPTRLLELGIVSSRGTRRQFQSRSFGNGDGFVTHPLAQQSLRADRAILEPIQPAAVTNPVFLSPYRYTEESPLLTNNRMPGGWYQQSVGRDLHHGASHEYRRFEQSGRVSPPEDDGEDAHACFKGLFFVLVAVVLLVWWCWHSK
jgi:hypothetical protein